MDARTITGRDPRSGRCISLIVENGVIARVEDFPGESEFFLSPGLVDLQVNGYAGFDVNADELTTDAITELVEAMLSRGVTCFAPDRKSVV